MEKGRSKVENRGSKATLLSAILNLQIVCLQSSIFNLPSSILQGVTHSYLSAIIGSTLMALRVGT
jgi:hypothetical protein